MGYNISEVSGASTGGLDVWEFSADLNDGSVTTVSGDFDVVSTITGQNQGEATDGYTFSNLSTTQFGTLSFNTTDGTFTFTIDRSAVIASGSDQVVSFTVTGTSGGSSDADTVNINILICLMRGTNVRTPKGDVPVETLRAGDLVSTDDDRAVPVRWIGVRRLTAAELREAPELRPVRIRAGAFGAGRPQRDMWVSPQHRIALDDWRAELLFGTPGVLAPAKGLVNGQTVTVDDTVEDVEYFHVLCDRHEILVTEGLPTESFHPGSHSLSGLDEAVRAELVALFPDLAEDVAGPAAAAPAIRPWEAKLVAGDGRG